MRQERRRIGCATRNSLLIQREERCDSTRWAQRASRAGRKPVEDHEGVVDDMLHRDRDPTLGEVCSRFIMKG